MSSESRDRNLDYWSSAPIVAQYAVQTGLTPPEEAFVSAIPELGTARLLDIGVGGGRTSEALVGRVAEYTGIDYAEPLVAACRERFAGTDLDGRISTGDARDLSAYADGSFDVVLFGSNGIDYVDDAGRRTALAECRRVLTSTGWCAVSSHNLNALGGVLSVRERLQRLRADRSLTRLPLAMARHLPRRMASIVRNPPARELMARPWAVIADDSRMTRPTHTYYVSPAEMTRQVTTAGFEVSEVMTPTGTTVADPDGDPTPWLFWMLRPSG